MSSVSAGEKCSILFINLNHLLSGKNINTEWSQTLIHNLLYISYKKNISLLKKIIFQ